MEGNSRQSILHEYLPIKRPRLDSTSLSFTEDGNNDQEETASDIEDDNESLSSERSKTMNNTDENNIMDGNQEGENMSHGLDRNNALNIDDIYNFSVFKLDNSRLKGIDKVDNSEQLYSLIKTKIEKPNKRFPEEVPINENVTEGQDFNIKHFYHMIEQQDNFTATQVPKQDTGKKYPGDRNSGNIVILYRMKNDEMGVRKPEAFFLCNGNGFYHILSISDPSFRTKIAKHFIDGKKIREIETLNIAGPDINTKVSYKGTQNLGSQSSMFLEKAISTVTAVIKADSKLNKLIQEDGKKELLINVGLNYVRVFKSLSLKRWCKVVTMFSEAMYLEVERSDCHFLNVLDYVRRVVDDEEQRTLNDDIANEATDIFCNEASSDSFFFSHRYIRDWNLSSNVALMFQTEKNKFTEMKSWYSSPTIQMVVDAIHKYFRSEEDIKQFVEQRRIHLQYCRRDKAERHPIQDYVHGHVSSYEGSYFKIGQKWFFFSSTFSQVVDRNFAYLSKCVLDKQHIVDQLKYPWIAKISVCITSEEFKHFFNCSDEMAKRVLDTLTEEVKLVNDENICNLTEKSCLLPKSSDLFRELSSKNETTDTSSKKHKSKRKRKGQQEVAVKPDSSISNTEPTLTGNGYTGSANEPSTSADRSAPLQNNLYDANAGSASTSMDPETINANDSLWDESDNTVEQNKNGIRLKLLHYSKNCKSVSDEHFLSALKRKRQICKQRNERYYVRNPILTKTMLEKLTHDIPTLKEERLLNFLKSKSVLSETEYNELYLHHENEGNLIVLPGDTICPNQVELFDLLIHDSDHRTTYLFHNKHGIDHIFRDACAQVRNSSELLWYDFIQGRPKHIEWFWERVVESKSADSVYRQILKKKLKELGRDGFKSLFENVQLVFVLAFVDSGTTGKKRLNFPFKSITAADIGENYLTVLQKTGFLTQSGYLTDVFLGMTMETFVERCKLFDELKEVTKKDLKDIYRSLKEHGSCDMSTIAKLELLTLDACFAKYQIGGGERKFSLKLLQLKSS